MKLKNKWLYTTATLAMAIGGPAVAKDESGQIIVTARRVEERLQDVPISVTVFDQAQLTARNVATATDLATYTPSLQASGNFGASNSTFSIRGFVQDNFTAPSVGVYFADVISPRGASSLSTGDGAGPGSFFDLQNVQVLKGPQGTLFGRNTTGGAILLVPQKPKAEFGGYVQATGGDFGLVGFEGVVNVPISDNVRLRAGVEQKKREGHLKNYSPIGPKDFGDIDYIAGRVSLSVDLAPNLENYTVATYANSDNNGFFQTPTECRAGASITGGGGVVLPTGNLACAQLARLQATGDFYAVENVTADPYNRQEQWSLINTTTWDVSDNLTVKNIVSYAELENSIRGAPFGTYWVVQNNGPVTGDGVRPGFLGQVITPNSSTTTPPTPFNHQYTFTEEFQLQGSALDGRLDWQGGVYFEVSKPVNGFTGGMGPTNGRCDATGFDVAANTPDSSQCIFPYDGSLNGLGRNVRTTEFEDKAVYVQGTYKLTERLSATLGLRYTEDQTTGSSKDQTFRFTNGALSSTTCSAGAATSLAIGCLLTTTQESGATTGVFDLEYRPNDDLMVYGKYSRGYRQGTVNPRGARPYDSFGQEKVDSYEVGAKGSWQGALPGYANLAIHYNDFANQQLLISFIDARGSTNASACDCGTSEIWGAELDGVVTLAEGLKLSGALSYLHTELVAFAAPTVLPFSYIRFIPGNEVGFPLNQSPEWKGSATISYRLPLSESIGDITLAGTYTYTDDYYTKSVARALIESRGLLNLNANWDGMFGKPVDFSIFATNVTDEQYYTFTTDLYDSSLAFTSKSIGEPRMIGARLRYRFGGDAE